MAIRALIKYAGPTPPAVKRALPRIMKRGLNRMARKWLRENLRIHFTEEGARRYDYTPRDPKYVRAKRKKVGHNRPLVSTGKTRKQALSRSRVRGTSSRVKVTINAPGLNRSNRRARGGRKINMRDEVTRLTDREDDLLQAFMARYVNGEISKVRDKRVRRIR